MKKTIIALLAISTLIGACSKATNKSAGSWTFKGVTYNATFGNYVLGAFTGYTQENLPSGSLAFTFCDSNTHWTRNQNDLVPRGTAPTGGGTYTLSPVFLPDSGQVFVRLTDTSAKRSYTSANGTGTVTAYYDTARKVTTVDVTNVVLKSDKDPSDSGVLSAHLVQINYK